MNVLVKLILSALQTDQNQKNYIQVNKIIRRGTKKTDRVHCDIWELTLLLKS